MTSRTDWRPSAHDRAVLAGRRPSYASPGYELAAAIRRLNAHLAELPPERQAELQADWLASWAELQRQLDSASDDLEQRFTLIDDWAKHWLERLG
jgi:hypothetical protein